MVNKKQQQQQNQLSLFNASQYERTITEWSIDCDGWEPESSPVVRDSVERENFLDLGLPAGDTPTVTADKSSPVAI